MEGFRFVATMCIWHKHMSSVYEQQQQPGQTSQSASTLFSISSCECSCVFSCLVSPNCALVLFKFLAMSCNMLGFLVNIGLNIIVRNCLATQCIVGGWVAVSLLFAGLGAIHV